MNNEEQSGKAAGGFARAASLSSEERKDIAKKAALARWSPDVKLATHGSPDKPLDIGGVQIPCYVLEDETRVLSQRGMQTGIGMSTSGGTSGAHRLAQFIEGLVEKGINCKDLSVRIRNPIHFRPAGTGKLAYGYEATILADICDAVLEARKVPGVLTAQQAHMANQCELMVRGFARVGIIALVDEATGFQRDRAKDALVRILEKFIAKELRPWVHTFPNEFYENLFRLRELEYPRDSNKKPSYFGHLTNNIVYDRLAPAVREALKKKTPRNAEGRHTTQLHRSLSEEVGHPKLKEHLASVISLMKISDGYPMFEKFLDKAHPKFTETLPLPFTEDGANPSLGSGFGLP